MEEEMIVPLFSFDSSSGEVDINCYGGDICYVTNMFTTPDDPSIAHNRDKLMRLIGRGTKITSLADTEIEVIREMMLFVDLLLKKKSTQERDKWEQLYSLLAYEYQCKRSK